MFCIFGLISQPASASWLTRAVVFSAAASIGGILVLFGLWMEKGAENDWFLNADDLRRQKLKAKWGWRFLMLGILVEIGTGAALAGYDVRENIQTAQQIAKNDPLKKPIMSATAVITLSIGETNDATPNTHSTMLIFGDKFGTPPTSGWDIKRIVFELLVDKNINSLKVLQCVSLQHADSIVKNGHVMYVISLNLELISSQKQAIDSMSKQVLPPGTAFPAEANFSVEDFDKRGFAAILTPTLPDGFEIKDGTCSVIMNSTKRSFSVPEHSKGGLTELIKSPAPANNE